MGWFSAMFGGGSGAPDPHGAASHIGDIFPDAAQALQDNYLDIDELAAPANPAAGTRRIFVNAAGGKLSVKTPAGVVNSLEESGAGTPSATVADLDGTGSAGVSSDYSRGDHKHADSNRPTNGQKDALAGTSGTPGSINAYVTDSDPRLSGGGGAPTTAQYLTLATDAGLSAERVLSPRDLLRGVDAGADGAYSLDYDPNDPTCCVIQEEFLHGGLTDGILGALGWRLRAIGATPAVSVEASALPNLGALTFTSSTTSGQGGALTLDSGPNGCLGDLSSVAGWEATWIFKISSTADIRARFGLMGAATAAAQPTNGIWIRLDTNLGDTQYTVECRKASTSTLGGTTIIADTNYHKIRIRSTSAGTIGFTCDGGTEQTIATNVPTVSLCPQAIVVTDAGGASKAMTLDWFSCKIRGLSR